LNGNRFKFASGSWGTPEQQKRGQGDLLVVRDFPGFSATYWLSVAVNISGGRLQQTSTSIQTSFGRWHVDNLHVSISFSRPTRPYSIEQIEFVERFKRIPAKRNGFEFDFNQLLRRANI
jgi:hypothetical protein